MLTIHLTQNIVFALYGEHAPNGTFLTPRVRLLPFGTWWWDNHRMLLPYTWIG